LSYRGVVRLIGSKTRPPPPKTRPPPQGRPSVAVESPAPIGGTPVRPPKRVESTPKPVKAWAKEHAPMNEARLPLSKAGVADACPYRRRRTPRAPDRCRRGSRSKSTRRGPVSPTAEVAAATAHVAATAAAHVAATAAHVAATTTTLCQRQRRLNRGRRQHTDSKKRVPKDKTAKEARHRTTPWQPPSSSCEDRADSLHRSLLLFDS